MKPNEKHLKSKLLSSNISFVTILRLTIHNPFFICLFIVIAFSTAFFSSCSKPKPTSPSTIERIQLETEKFGPDGKLNLYIAIDARLFSDDSLAVLYENRGVKNKTDFKLLNRLVKYDVNGKKEITLFPDLWFAHSLVISKERTYIISDHGHNRILEVDPGGEVLLEINKLKDIPSQSNFNSASLTKKGNILACVRDWGILEFDRKGTQVWKYKIDQLENQSAQSHGLCHDATETSRGHILYAKTCTEEIFEIDRKGKVVWKFHHDNIKIPKNAKRLKNGNTIIAHSNGLTEVSFEGKIVQERRDLSNCYNFNIQNNGDVLLTHPIKGILLLDNMFKTKKVFSYNSPKSWDHLKKTLPPEDVDRLKALGYLS